MVIENVNYSSGTTAVMFVFTTLSNKITQKHHLFCPKQSYISEEKSQHYEINLCRKLGMNDFVHKSNLKPVEKNKRTRRMNNT